MSIHPFSIEYDRARSPCRLMDQHFGLGITPRDYMYMAALPNTNENYRRHWWNRNPVNLDIGSTIKEDKTKFQVNLNQFSPDEISVKTADGYLVVEAKHEERKDEHGFISRRLSRRYPLPESIDPSSVIAKLSSNGILIVSAPLEVPPRSADERIVPIVQTGPVRKQRGGEEQ